MFQSIRRILQALRGDRAVPPATGGVAPTTPPAVPHAPPAAQSDFVGGEVRLPPPSPPHLPPPSPPVPPPPYVTHDYNWRPSKPAEHVVTGDVPAPGYRDVPGGRTVRGNLRIVRHTRLRSIGDDLRVTGDLQIGGHPLHDSTASFELRRVPIRALPRGLRVDKSLALRNCFRLERLPDDLFVGGDVTIDDCDALVALPDPFEVAGSLTINGGQSLAALPTRLHVAGDLKISGTRITALPADLFVGGRLVIEGRCRLKDVPGTVRVGGDVVLRRCHITEFPAGLRVARTLRLIGCRKLVKLPEGLDVPEKLDLTDCSALESLPQGLRVGRSLKLKGCTSLRSLPDGLAVPYTLDLRGCTGLTVLSRGLRVGFGLAAETIELRPPVVPPRRPNFWSGSTPIARQIFTPVLRLADCSNLSALPDDIQFEGPIDVAGSGLTDLPPSLKHVRVLWRSVLVRPDVVFHPERIDPADVLREPNAELRRVMLERLGADAVLAAVKAQVRDEDTDAGGPRRLVYVGSVNRWYLHCRCPSTARQYLLRVPPNTRSCRHAAAWMAGYDDPDRYRPAVET